MTIQQIRAALCDACQTAGLNATGYIPDDVTTPAAVIRRDTINYDQTMGRGSDEIMFTVTVIVDRVDEQGAQDLLDQWCDPAYSDALKNILEADAVVAAAGAHYIRVRSVSGVNVSTWGQVTYLSVDFELEVMV